MTDYTKLAKALREQSGSKCTDPICSKECDQYKECGTRIIQDAADAIEELQAQLTKRGKWVWDDKRCIYVCSVCGSPKVRENMDRQIIKEQAYCYSCGAKMEVQDGQK